MTFSYLHKLGFEMNVDRGMRLTDHYLSLMECLLCE